MTPQQQTYEQGAVDWGAPAEMDRAAAELKNVATELESQADAMKATRLTGQGKLVERNQAITDRREKSLRDTGTNLRALALRIEQAAETLRGQQAAASNTGGKLK